MPLLLTLYSASGCSDTGRTRAHLHKLGIPFHGVDSDYDPEAVVVFISHDDRGLSALGLSEGTIEIVTIEPVNQESDQMFIQGGYSIPHTIQ